MGDYKLIWILSKNDFILFFSTCNGLKQFLESWYFFQNDKHAEGVL